MSSKNLGRASHTSVPTTALPGATNSSRDSSARHERYQCAESARSCLIAQRPLCPLPRIVTMMFCPAPSRLELVLTITIEDNVAPPAQFLFPVTSSLATLAIMMKTRRRRPQRLRSGQKCRSSKIIHSGGKQSPEDLLTRPHCWKDSGLRLYINYII